MNNYLKSKILVISIYMNCEDTVTKRNGKIEAISFDKILKRVKSLGKDELQM